MLELIPICSSNVMFTYAAILLCMIAVVPTILRWLRIRNITRDIPGPSGHPLIGNLLDLIQPTSLHKFLHQNNLQFGKLYKFWVLNKLIVVLSDPAVVKFVMNNLKENNRPEYLTTVVKATIGNGMLTMRDGGVYRAHKRMMNPMFYPAMLKNYHLKFEQKLQSLCQRLSQQADGTAVDIFHYLSSYTLELICSTIIGCDVTSMDKSAKEYIEVIQQGEYVSPRFTFLPWLRIPWIQRLFSSGRKLVTIQKRIKTFINRIVTEKIQTESQRKHFEATGRAISEVPVEKEEDDGRREVLSMLDKFVRADESGSEKFSVGEIKDELQSFITAGFVTTASTIALLFILLGIHEEVQEEVSRELEEVFGSSLRAATTEDLSRLVVLDRVIKETLRLFPQTPVLPREISEDVRLPSGTVLPAGTDITVDVFHIHRDPKSYHDPESFIPDRWRPENSILLNPDAFIPFGVGPRMCIGFRYAMLQMKVTTSKLLRRFKVTTSYKMEDLTNIGTTIPLNLNCEYNIYLHEKKMASVY